MRKRYFFVEEKEKEENIQRGKYFFGGKGIEEKEQNTMVKENISLGGEGKGGKYLEKGNIFLGEE